MRRAIAANDEPRGVLSPGPGLAKTEWPSVEAFEHIMIQKLRERSKRHGGPGSWYRHSTTELLAWLHREVAELEEALDRLEFSEADPGYEKSVLVGQVARECADVANLASFIADVVGGLGAA